MAVKKTPLAGTIQSLDRGLAILQAVAACREPMSLGDVAGLLQVDRSTAFRLLHTLRQRGFLANPATSKDYILGSTVWTLSHHYDWSQMLVRIASSHLKLLATETNETAHIAIREGKNALFIDYAVANQLVSVAGRHGQLLPLYCTAHGKALLADATAADLKTIFGTKPLRKHTPTTLTSLAELGRDCASINKRGYATDEAEYRAELRCIAAPIRTPDGDIVGSIGISAPATRMTAKAFQTCAERVRKSAEEIGGLLSVVGSPANQAGKSISSKNL